MKTLAIAMVVKNEGQTIYRALDSVKSIADEYVIGVDDATTDNTEAEVRRFAADNQSSKVNLYTFTWESDFAKARNTSIEKVTSDYFMVLDGHEYFPAEWFNITENQVINQQEVLLEVKKILGTNDEDELFIQLYQQPFNGYIPDNFFLQPRIYIKRDNVRFTRASHNVISGINHEKVIHLPELILVHDAPESNRKERTVQRVEMNTANLSADVEKNQGNDPRALFYLGNTLLEAKDHEKAISAYNKYIAIQTVENSELYQCLIFKAMAENASGLKTDARNSLYRAMSVDPTRRDAIMMLGDLYYEVGQHENALQFYKQVTTIRPKPSRMFQSGRSCTWLPYQNMSRVYNDTNNKTMAISSLKKAMRYFNHTGWDRQIREWEKREKVYVIDAIGSFSGDLIKHLQETGREVVVSRQFDKNLATWADVIWQEWCDQNAALSAHYPEKTVVRIHGYELYQYSDLIKTIPWGKMRGCVLVSEHMKDKMLSMGVLDCDRIKVVHNGVDLKRFNITKEKNRNGVGYAGYINEKKNPFLMIQIVKANPDIDFYFKVAFQSPYWAEAFAYYLRSAKNVHFEQFDDKVPEFWNERAGCLSTSITESFSYNIAEAMACGVRPYILRRPGAVELFGDAFIFDTMPDFSTLEKVASHEYHNTIRERYDIETALKTYEQILFEGKK